MLRTKGITPLECITDIVVHLEDKCQQSDVHLSEFYEISNLWMKDMFEVSNKRKELRNESEISPASLTFFQFYHPSHVSGKFLQKAILKAQFLRG